MDEKTDQLAAEGAEALVAGLRSAGWERVRDRFTEWFDRRGQDECVHALRALRGPAEFADTEKPIWRDRLSEALADAWDLDGADELASVMQELSLPPTGEAPAADLTPAPVSVPAPVPVPVPALASAPDPVVPGDRFDFQGITVNGQFVGVQHVRQTGGDAPGGAPQSPSVDWPSAQDMDPLAYGVRPTRRGNGLPQLPPYVARDADPAVKSALEQTASEGGLVVVRGDAFAGKSRTALAAMAEVLPDVRVFAPARHENLRQLPALLRSLPGERCALWLDDLDGHLGDGGLEPRLLAQLTGQGVAVVATMSEDTYDEFRKSSRGRVLDLAHIVELPREWSHGERKRAGETEDPRLKEAARRSGAEGVAGYLAVGPMLWEEWQRARRADRHPRGYALVLAAVDLARCGLRGRLPQDLLVQVHEGYEGVAGLDRESVDDALAWAAEKRHGVLGLLTRSGARTWEVSPCLVETASQDETFPAVDGAVWGVALEVARTDSAYDSNVVVAGARRAFRVAAEAGGRWAMHSLGLLEESLGDAGEAETWFRRAAETGHAEAAGRLGRMLAERGKGREAEPFLEAAAEAGDHMAATLLGRLLVHRAEGWLEAAAKAGNPEAAHRAGDLFLGKGQLDVAYVYYVVAERLGLAEAARSLGAYNLLMNRPELANVWLTRAMSAGDRGAVALMSFTGRASETLDDAVEYLEMFSDYLLDITHLGVVREKQGRLADARRQYEMGYEAGDAYAAYRLAVLYEKENRPAQANAWYRLAADMNHPAAKKALGEKPETPDTVTE
ncbi:SEL1-like repeat protein [Streptomyces sp. B21-083]|uniref:SEL1-like repeat protein n=1 Tax=Streptomyces sp. B21-083 TaxID=3039410 RepID=UPI002FEF4E68